jgi:putative hydrolase of HD superfamily
MGNLEGLTDFFIQSNRLKQTIRYSSCPEEIQESSAGHSWHVTLMVPIIAQELGLNVNIQHSMELACVHDLAEAVLKKDFDSYLVFSGVLNKKDKDRSEEEEMGRIRGTFGFGSRIYSLWEEYQECKNFEARFVKALDKLESHLHIIERGGPGDNVSDGRHQATYADNAVKNFPELEPFLRVIKQRLRPLFEKQGLTWYAEFNYPN